MHWYSSDLLGGLQWPEHRGQHDGLAPFHLHQLPRRRPHLLLPHAAHLRLAVVLEAPCVEAQEPSS